MRASATESRPAIARVFESAGAAYVIGEAGVNHDGDVDVAIQLIDAISDAGCDAAKFQMFTTREMVCGSAPIAGYQRATATGSQVALLERLELPESAWEAVRRHCVTRGIDFLATPFSLTDLRRLAAMDTVAIKFSSTDLDNVPLVREACHLNVPLLVSTGASSEEEIARAAERLAAMHALSRTVLLHCVSAYPTRLGDANLRAIGSLSAKFGATVGYSDHTRSEHTGAWAVAMGARVVEKHVTLDSSSAGPDHAASLMPSELSAFVARIREVEMARGDGSLAVSPVERDVRRVARKSIVAARAIGAGERLDVKMLAVKRPAGGLSAECWDDVVGRVARCSIALDQQIDWDLLE